MLVRIRSVRLGDCHVYLLQGDGTILVDAGNVGYGARFRDWLQHEGISPQEIGLILLTHAHGDHAGSAKEIQELTGAPVAVHGSERDWLARGEAPIPPGTTPWGRVLIARMRRNGPLQHYLGVEPAVLLGEEEVSLAPYGIPGSAVHTPGHTPGSVCVVLESGEAFAGDMAMSGIPHRLGAGLPVMGEDISQMCASWRSLLGRGITTIYPAHGHPFAADAMRRDVERFAPMAAR